MVNHLLLVFKDEIPEIISVADLLALFRKKTNNQSFNSYYNFLRELKILNFIEKKAHDKYFLKKEKIREWLNANS
jgi:hypothetical protein